MATFTNTVAPQSTAAVTFYTWAHPIAAFMSTAGWLQNNDTGQIVWPASIFNITDANGGGVTVTFTGTITNGTSPLRVGMQIKVSGTTNFGTVGVPILYTVTGGNLTTTWTAASGTNAHDAAIAANTGWGMAYVQPSISAVTGNGSVATYTYTNTDGILCPGQSIVIPSAGTTGFTNTGFNGTFTITAVAATTFTAVNGTNASETKAVLGTVATTTGALSTSSSTTTTFPPAASNSLYEVWKMGDANGFPVYLKILYGGNTTAAADVGLGFVLCAGTDGAGTATGGSTGTLTPINATANTASTFACWMSGSTNRLQLAMWPSTTQAATPMCLSIERSHDTSGVDTTAYATISYERAVAGGASSTQISITTTSQTVAETRLPVITQHSTGTGSFGSSTLVSPVFPVVGAIGNPMIGLLVGKTADWLDTTQFSFTLYNTAHNYIVFNTAAVWVTAGIICYDSVATCCIMMRYE